MRRRILALLLLAGLFAAGVCAETRLALSDKACLESDLKGSKKPGPVIQVKKRRVLEIP
jgi:hypothetical protein